LFENEVSMRMLFRCLTCVAGLLAAWPFAWVEAAPPGNSRSDENENSPAGDARAKRVLVIGIDGTRPDALLRAETPNLDRLIREGTFTDTAQVLGTRYDKNDTVSGPGWSSLLTGVWADKHGVHDNAFKGARFEAFPHFFKRLKDARPGARTVSLVSWEPIHQFILAEADIRRTEPLSPETDRPPVDLKGRADRLKIDTRDGQWHHLLARREGDTVTLYLDGQLAGERKGAGEHFDLGGAFYHLGRDTRAGETRFEGQLDTVRLWTRALSEPEIRQAAKTSAPADRNGLLIEYLFDAAPGGADAQGTTDQLVFDSAGHPAGPFHAAPVAKSHPLTFRQDKAPGSRSLSLPSENGPEHGARLPLAGPLKSITQGDFTIEARFRTTKAGRNILLGNFAGRTGALNLELHENNTVRVWIQPPSSGDSGLSLENERDRRMAENAAEILTRDDPDALFVYFHQVDATGHTIGFSPDIPGYVQAIENVDRHVGTVLKGLQSRATYAREDWLTIVCTDHGGFKTGHGGGHKNPEIRNVFLIVSGPSAQVGRCEEPAFLVDVAGTALAHLLGRIDPKWELDGRAVGLKPQP